MTKEVHAGDHEAALNCVADAFSLSEGQGIADGDTLFDWPIMSAMVYRSLRHVTIVVLFCIRTYNP